jgi:hypothetical protein
MEKPMKENYGYVESSGFDSEPSGFVIEGGEEAYHEALKTWQFMQDNGLGSISGCFIVNNEKSPKVSKHYRVIYTDGTHGMEYFDGNTWIVKYYHPVKLWWLILK